MVTSNVVKLSRYSFGIDWGNTIIFVSPQDVPLPVIIASVKLSKYLSQPGRLPPLPMALAFTLGFPISSWKFSSIIPVSSAIFYSVSPTIVFVSFFAETSRVIDCSSVIKEEPINFISGWFGI